MGTSIATPQSDWQLVDQMQHLKALFPLQSFAEHLADACFVSLLSSSVSNCAKALVRHLACWIVLEKAANVESLQLSKRFVSWNISQNPIMESSSE